MKSPNLPSAENADTPQPAAKLTNATWRHATDADEAWITELQELSFGPGRFAKTAFRVRERYAIDPDLTLIAEVDGKPVSSVLMTPISIGGVDGYMLGPLATDPTFRGKGAARLLVQEACRLALANGQAKYVILIGDKAYYGLMGFVPTKPGSIVFPGPVDPARVLVFTPDAALAETLGGALAAFGAGR